MPLKASYLLMIGGGAVVAYSGLKGKGIGSAFRNVVAGQTPAKAAAANVIMGLPGGSSSGISGTVGNFFGVSGTTGDVQAGPGEQAFYTAFLEDLGAPVTNQNLQAMYRWSAKEEPNWPPQASGISWTWNPLNILQSTSQGGNYSGQTGMSYASYPTPQAGAAATAAWLVSNGYAGIVSSLRTGQGIVDSTTVAQELSAFSGGGYTSVNTPGG